MPKPWISIDKSRGIFFLAGLCVIMIIPTGIVAGATNLKIWYVSPIFMMADANIVRFNVLGEYVAGYAMPGKRGPNTSFKSF